MLTERRTTWKQ